MSLKMSHTMRTTLFSLLLLSFIAPRTVAQNEIDYSLNNEFRYGIGEQTENEATETKEYLENLFNARFFIGDFRLGFRAQIDRPREFGPDTVGITEYFGEFRRDQLTVRGGTFHNLVGQGMVFHTFERRPIGFNTLAEGVNAEYKDRRFKAGLYGGTIDYVDILGNNTVETYLTRGAWGEGSPIDEVTVGTSFLAASGERTRTGFRQPFDAYLREGWVEGNVGPLSGIFNWADKRTAGLDSAAQALTSSNLYGTGWYANLTYTGDLFSLTGEYKDYRFDLVEPQDRDVANRSTRALPFQNAPTLVPEHDKTLLARNPHTIDFSDEVGFQISGLVYPDPDLILSFLFSAASRHAAWEPVVMTDTFGIESLDHRLIDDKRLSFPEMSDERYSPYTEIYVQAEYSGIDRLPLIVGFQQKKNTIFYDRLLVEIPEPFIETYETTTGMVDATWSIDRKNALHAIVEVQSAFDSKKVTAAVDTAGIAADDGKFMNLLGTFEFSRSPLWSANFRLEWTSTDKEQGGRRIWPVIGGTYRIGRTHTVGAQYGYERGGVVCTGGVCRFINPFTGLRVSLISSI